MFSQWKAFLFNRRPEINEQNTGREAFQRVTGLAFAPSNGGAGIVFTGSPSPFNLPTFMPGPTLKVVDPTVTGNVSGSPMLQQLSDPMANIIGYSSGNI